MTGSPRCIGSTSPLIEIPPPLETWPIVEAEPEHEPVVPPDLRAAALGQEGRRDA